ncbi:MAG: ribosomal-protein-alanine N-acetyltransferase [Clostridiales bacterium 43-6]|nr:MAG: ribosomal-protein-alanine N-acetyltransferase [Clostridiales bacterium 43-6]
MIKIMQMTAFDVVEVAKLEQACFSSPWSEQSLLYAVNNANASYYVAKENKKIVGYGGLNYVIDQGYIGNIAVDKDYRRMGVGLSILKSLISFAEEKKLVSLSLEVRKSNKAAILMYEKCGFEYAGMRKDFYIWPTEDAIIMTKAFSKEGE